MINISLDDNNKQERLIPEKKFVSSSSANPNELSTIEKLTQIGREATKYNFEEMALSPDCEKYNS
jgi:hypothetical protein